MRRAPAVALTLLCLAPACGKRGDPLPPLRRNPEPIRDLSVVQRGGELEVSFTAPQRSVDGVPLPVLEVQILRTEGDGRLDEVSPVRLRAAPGEALTEVWPLPRPGTALRLAIRSLAGGRPSDLSPELRYEVREPPAPPSDLTAQLESTGLLLSWSECVPTTADPWVRTMEPSADLLSRLAQIDAVSRGEPAPPVETPQSRAADASSPAAAPQPQPTPPSPGIVLFRRVADGPFERLTPAPVAGTFLDSAVESGEQYCYRARTVLSGQPPVEGLDSGEICLGFRDTEAPAAPRGLTLLRRDGAVELTWTPSSENDLASYRVYRAPAGRRAPRPIAELAAGETRYRDEAPPPGVVLVYTLTAVDEAGNESPPTSEARVRPE